MVKLREDLPPWQVASGLFQKFDNGGVVEAPVPATWNLKPNEGVKYQVGPLSGVALVIRVGKQHPLIVHNGTQKAEVVEGVLCTFRKMANGSTTKT